MAYDVVVFGAHPDDAEMGMGGTVAKLARAGRRVLLVSLTRGECGTYGSQAEREREAARAAEVLECDHRLLDFPDSRIEPDLEARERIMQLLRELQPRIVFAPYHSNRFGHHDGMAHVDHLATGVIVRDAVKLARMRGVERESSSHDVQRLYFYMVPRDRYPTLLVDVTAEYAVLVRAIEAYESQMAIERHGRAILEILQTYRRYYGIAAGCEYAEPFLCEEALRADVDTLFSL
ncbi:MAG: PIG-L family deacetylase [Candidatus Latescibacterota bacterium]|nr:MAG: PIG-L family deacetylase [Candidatus Latescibacterota bacterium]